MKYLEQILLKDTDRIEEIIKNNPCNWPPEEITKTVKELLRRIFEMGVNQGELNAYQKMTEFAAKKSEIPQESLDTLDLFMEPVKDDEIITPRRRDDW